MSRRGRRLLVGGLAALAGVGLVLYVAVNVLAVECRPHTWARFDVRNISGVVNLYRADRGRYPTTAEGFGWLVTEGYLNPNWAAGFKDPWGRQYVYQSPGRVHPEAFDVTSYGADGKPGGRGEDADIVNEL